MARSTPRSHKNGSVALSRVQNDRDAHINNRSNTLLINGPLSRRLRYRALITHLDTPSGDAGDTQVRYLNYADAETLATTLQMQFSVSAGDSSEQISLWADPGTNSLIINAPAKTLQDMNAVIDKLDNEEAEIEVGSEVPFLTGQYSGAGTTAGTLNPFQTIDRTPVGTRLMMRHR